MRPSQFHNQNQHHANANTLPLKISKDSHFIKKPSPPRSSSSSSSSNSSLVNGVSGVAKPPHQHRQPVIIYTQSPKVIHTHPRDFMALVQKLTGLSRSSSDDDQKKTQPDHNVTKNSSSKDQNKSAKVVGSDDNDSSSVVTEEKCGNLRDGLVDSCLVPPMFDPPPSSFMANMPVFKPNSMEFLMGNQSVYNYTDSFFFNPNMRSSISSSSSSMEGINEFRQY